MYEPAVVWWIFSFMLPRTFVIFLADERFEMLPAPSVQCHTVRCCFLFKAFHESKTAASCLFLRTYLPALSQHISRIRLLFSFCLFVQIAVFKNRRICELQQDQQRKNPSRWEGEITGVHACRVLQNGSLPHPREPLQYKKRETGDLLCLSFDLYYVKRGNEPLTPSPGDH